MSAERGPAIQIPRFVPGQRAPADQPHDRALWFAFRGDRLLVQTSADAAELPTWQSLAELGAAYDACHYLGRLGDTDCYALELHESVQAPPGTELQGLRGLFGRLSDELFAVAGRASMIVEWDRSHCFCGRCGEPTVRSATERAKQCPRCGLLSFPRLSPAVIMLVERGDEILLGRGRNFPEAFYSTLAGFVEPGESLEEAVAREVREEVGVEIADIRYFGSQSWPFPHSLMIGFTTTYVAGDIRVDPDELVDARWFRKDDLPRLPGKISIARRLIDWAAERREA